MATSTAAGLAALVREYLQRGFYPTGQRVAANAIPNPSGALIKAILISGAATMNGAGADAAPGQSQGFGRILLDTRCTSTAMQAACTSTTRPQAWPPAGRTTTR